VCRQLDELDEQAEDFLVKEFDQGIDYQVEEALPRLERWGLVTRDEQVRGGRGGRGRDAAAWALTPLAERRALQA
jgi:hypothetical protein